MFTIMSKAKTSTSKDNVKERDSGGPDTGAGPSGGNVTEDLSSEPQRKASLMQRTDTILERIDAEGGEEAEPQEEGGDGTVPFVDIDDIPQNGQLVVGDALGYEELGELSAGYLRNHNVLRGDDEISDAMASSLVCTDGSDVEVLSDREMSDAMESGAECGAGLLDNVNNRLDNMHISAEQNNVNTNNDVATTSGRSVQPIDAVVHVVQNQPKVDETQARLLLEKSESIRSSDSDSDMNQDINQDVNQDEELMSVSMTGTFDSPTRQNRGQTGTDSPPASGPSVNRLVNVSEILEQIANGSINRPDSLSLPRPLQYYERQHRKLVRSDSKSSSCSNYSQSSTEALIEAATSTPLHVQGKLTRQGDSVEFVAEDLDEKIRMSSPHSKREAWLVSRTSSNRSISSINSLSSSTSGLSTSSASGWSAVSNTSGAMSRSPSVVTQSPEDIPPIDPRAVLELELYARRVASSLDQMMSNLNTNLHKMSHITVGCVDAYKDGIDRTCDSVDASIKSMYALMAKCEELSTNIRLVYRLADQIKEIKRLLDLFEAQLAKDEKPTP